MLPAEKEVLIRWLNSEFRDACNNDKKRLLESAWLLKVGYEKGDDIESIMAYCISSFVVGLIQGTKPITVPDENN